MAIVTTNTPMKNSAPPTRRQIAPWWCQVNGADTANPRLAALDTRNARRNTGLRIASLNAFIDVMAWGTGSRRRPGMMATEKANRTPAVSAQPSAPTNALTDRIFMQKR
jgi:hypothetical protein